MHQRDPDHGRPTSVNTGLARMLRTYIVTAATATGAESTYAGALTRRTPTQRKPNSALVVNAGRIGHTTHGELFDVFTYIRDWNMYLVSEHMIFP